LGSSGVDVALGSGIGVSVAVTVGVSVGITSTCSVSVGSSVCVMVTSAVALLAGRLQAERASTPVIKKQKSWKKVVRMSPHYS